MPTLEQTYTINARRVVIKNFTAPESSVPALDPIDMPSDRVQPIPEGVELGSDHGVSGVTTELAHGVVPVLDTSLQSFDLFENSHTTSLRSDDARNRPPASSTPTVVERVAARADSPSAAATQATTGAHTASVVAPFYQDELVTLYCGDALKLTELWAHADVLITDPPYGLQALAGAYGTSHRQIANDMDTITRDAVLELWGDRPVAVFASPRMPEPPGAWSDRLVWDKGQLGLNGGPWRYAHENIFVRGAGWTRVDNRSTSVMRHTSQANRKHVIDHIHSKPLPLLQQLVAAAPPGVIVDPFAGGGPTVAAAKLLGRQIIAIELEESNCELIVDRLRQQSFPIATPPRHEQPQLPEA